MCGSVEGELFGKRRNVLKTLDFLVYSFLSSKKILKEESSFPDSHLLLFSFHLHCVIVCLALVTCSDNYMYVSADFMGGQTLIKKKWEKQRRENRK